MNYTHNRKFFERSFKLLIIGAVVMLVGVPLGYLNNLWMLSPVLILLGICLIVVQLTSGVKSTELLSLIDDAAREADKDIIAQYDLYDKTAKHIKSETIKSFCYNDGVLLKRASEGSGYISSEFYVTVLVFTVDTLVVRVKHVSFIEEKSLVTDTFIPYTDIKSVSLEEESKKMPCGKNTVTVKLNKMNIAYADKALTLSVRDDMVAEDIKSLLMRLSSKK